MRNDTFERVKECLISQGFWFDGDSEVTMNTSITDDLDLDSLDKIELVMALETEFDIFVPDELIENTQTIGDIVRVIDSSRQIEIDI